ncbi:hypothetical protein [Paenarthrobacter nicotinovorans]|uniref:hypothetical protein n=1 Tax=Paenarthrobacter TaxID=1742992 RepID=UPI003A80A52E
MREQEAAARQTEQAFTAEQRATAAFQRASEAERKRLEKEAADAHVADKQAEVEHLNAEPSALYDQVDSLLEATIEVDDYVNLEALWQTAQHPPFDRSLEIPTPPPVVLLDPEEPNSASCYLGSIICVNTKPNTHGICLSDSYRVTKMYAYENHRRTLSRVLAQQVPTTPNSNSASSTARRTVYQGLPEYMTWKILQ